MLVEALTGAARAEQVAGWHMDGEHEIAKHPACPVCHPVPMQRSGCPVCNRYVAIAKAQR
jgi:hypothetical protein